MSTPSDRNPYQPPKADVTPPVENYDSGELIANGQMVPGGNSLQWIAEGFRLFGKSPGVWIANAIILFVMTMVLAFIPFLGGFALNLLMPVFVGGLMLGCRALENGDQLEVGHLFAGFKEYAGQLVLVGVFLLVASIVVGILVVIIAIVTLGGGFLAAIGNQQEFASWLLERGLVMILLLVLVSMALFIPIAMASWFAPALVVFHKLDAISALKQSFLGSAKNFLSFLLYGIVLFALFIVACIPFGLGLLVFAPMVYASLYASYKDIFVTHEA